MGGGRVRAAAVMVAHSCRAGQQHSIAQHSTSQHSTGTPNQTQSPPPPPTCVPGLCEPGDAQLHPPHLLALPPRAHPRVPLVLRAGQAHGQVHGQAQRAWAWAVCGQNRGNRGETVSRHRLSLPDACCSPSARPQLAASRPPNPQPQAPSPSTPCLVRAGEGQAGVASSVLVRQGGAGARQGDRGRPGGLGLVSSSAV